MAKGSLGGGDRTINNTALRFFDNLDIISNKVILPISEDNSYSD